MLDHWNAKAPIFAALVAFVGIAVFSSMSSCTPQGQAVAKDVTGAVAIACPELAVFSPLGPPICTTAVEIAEVTETIIAEMEAKQADAGALKATASRRYQPSSAEIYAKLAHKRGIELKKQP